MALIDWDGLTTYGNKTEFLQAGYSDNGNMIISGDGKIKNNDHAYTTTKYLKSVITNPKFTLGAWVKGDAEADAYLEVHHTDGTEIFHIQLGAYWKNMPITFFGEDLATGAFPYSPLFVEVGVEYISGTNWAGTLYVNNNLIQTFNVSSSLAAMQPRRITFRVNENGADAYFGGWYITDGSSGAHTGRLGPVGFATSSPQSNDSVDFSPSTGSNFQTVADHSDTTFNTGLCADKDMFEMINPAVINGAVAAVNVHMIAKNDGIGSSNYITPVLNLGGTEYNGPSKIITADVYSDKVASYVVNPASGNRFSYSDLNSLKAGYKIEE